MTNGQVLYYSILAVCAILGKLSTSFLLQVVAWIVVIAVVLGKVILENMCSYDH